MVHDICVARDDFYFPIEIFTFHSELFLPFLYYIFTMINRYEVSVSQMIETMYPFVTRVAVLLLLARLSLDYTHLQYDGCR